MVVALIIDLLLLGVLAFWMFTHAKSHALLEELEAQIDAAAA